MSRNQKDKRLETQDSVLSIDRLDLRLPAGYAHRADAIARETARLLSRMPLPVDAHGRALYAVEHLTVPTVRIQGSESNRIIAGRIARGIHNQLQQSRVQTRAMTDSPLTSAGTVGRTDGSGPRPSGRTGGGGR